MGDLLIDFETNQSEQAKHELSNQQTDQGQLCNRKSDDEHLNEQTAGSLIENPSSNNEKSCDELKTESANQILDSANEYEQNSNKLTTISQLISNSNDKLTDEDRSDESLESNAQKRKVIQELNQKLVDEQKMNKELISKLHIQLDNAIAEKEESARKLSEKENDLSDVEKIIEEQRNKLKQLEDVESTNSKLKALAIKLKKELAEVKENVNKDVVDKSIKEQMKQQISNFNNLQKEYDRLHDEYEAAKKKIRSFENDLTLNLKELNATKIDLSNLKQDYEKLEKKCSFVEQQLCDEKDKGKELSSKIIILNNKLDEERKKTQNLNSLEKQINKLAAQLVSKQNEVIEINNKLKHLDDTKSDLMKIRDDHQLLKALNESLETEINKLRIENQELVKIVEENKSLQANNLRLNDELLNLKQSIEDKDKTFSLELEEMRKKFVIVEQQLNNKENEFNSYKIKVTKVLNERTNIHKNEDQTYLKEMSSLKKQLNESLETENQLKNELQNEKQLRNTLENELITLKSDLIKYEEDSSKLIIQQNENQNLKRKISQLDEKIKSINEETSKSIDEMQSKHLKEIEHYELRIKNFNEIKEEIKCKNCETRELNDKSNEYKDDKEYKNEMKNQSNSDNNTDLESLENTSINLKPKRFSTSTVPDLDYVNPLQEILNQSTTKTAEAELLDQLNELLKESESNNSLLTEQNRLLKEEVRRLERSIERTEIAKNLEYLKNILISFLSFENNTSDGSERTQLVPVLKTILKLSKEEEIKLKNFTTFMADAKQFQQQSNDKSNGWSWWSSGKK